MDTQKYADMVKVLKKPGQDIIDGLTPQKADLWHHATGVAGEAGELVDAIKKAAIYGKTIDIENVKEELGDLEFYMEGIRQNLGITREETIQNNVGKLAIRYASKAYSDEDAQRRADKA